MEVSKVIGVPQIIQNSTVLVLKSLVTWGPPILRTTLHDWSDVLERELRIDLVFWLLCQNHYIVSHVLITNDLVKISVLAVKVPLGGSGRNDNQISHHEFAVSFDACLISF